MTLASTDNTEGMLPPNARLPVLDGMRGLGMLLVLAYHQTLIGSHPPASILDAWFARVAGVAWCGLDSFFVLSGFLITGILLKAKGRAHYFRDFYARRTLRIFPLYYAVVFVSLSVVPHLPPSILPAEKLAKMARIQGDELWYWLYLSNYSIAAAGAFRHAILDVSWSLALEEQFYLVWPAVVLLLSRRALARLCLSMMLLALVLRVALVLDGTSWITIYVSTPTRMDALAVGAFIAASARSQSELSAFLPWARRLLLASGAALSALFLWRAGLSTEDPLVLTAGFSLTAIAFGSLLVVLLCASAESRLARFFSSSFLRVFGKYSYAIYLCHLPIRGFIRDRVYGWPPLSLVLGSEIPLQISFYVLSTAPALGLAWLSWNLYEKHFLRLKRFFQTRRSRPDPKLAARGSTPGRTGSTTKPERAHEAREATASNAADSEGGDS